jgi:hypothetical protein
MGPLNIFEKSATAIKPVHADVQLYRKFEKKFEDWIYSSNQTVKGLPEKSFLASGITDAFNMLYGMYNVIGIFPGEYSYHRLVLPKNRITYNLKKADVIIVSHPFSADGMSSIDRLLIADTYNKPIFVDCAYFGVCNNIDFDFTKYKNIDSVAFSLSKTFGTGSYRIAKIFSNSEYPAYIYDEWRYQLHSSAAYHYKLIDKISPDDTYNKFRTLQLDICKEYNLTPSDTVIFALDYDKSDLYKYYDRDIVNRMCISEELYKRSGVFYKIFKRFHTKLYSSQIKE